MLTLQNVTKIFYPYSADEKIALSNVTLTLEEGDFVTVIGSNGAGKSTLMNVVSGALVPELGTVTIDGTVVNGLSEHERSRWIGRVFQDPMAGTAPHMTIEENLALAHLRGGPRGLRQGVTREKRAMFRERLSSLGLGLESRLTARVGLLSGGERQALSLLMATFTQPKVLLLDEHTAALDPSRAALVTELTDAIVRGSRLTTLMVTHNMEQAIQLGNRLIMMDKGKIILDIGGEEKRSLTVASLLERFAAIRGERLADDRVVLG
ncbi:ABC transporter ATP-binding protein [Paenibacillus sp.]|uniref:ABC transporter ATP-binding protein n=1 Tax=Paenibacillus sp. TaxID=58172 RepID=UPI002D70C330|nr:ABC transporter ATP-binding protein [Paenibacillus sp.]HZG56971.1 ABC transporter ATP-binding protein [Paenibacillus sp.]